MIGHQAFTFITACGLMASALAAPAAITIDYPSDGSIFPPDIVAPTFLWRDATPNVSAWRIEIAFADDSKPLRLTSAGEPMRIGEIDPRCVSDTNQPPALTPEQAAAHTWKPDPATWSAIKRHSVEHAASITIAGLRKDEPVSEGRVTIITSKDPVGAPVFYRDVPLMPSETEKGTIKPLAPNAVPLIAWRLRDLAQSRSRVLMTGLPTCANCHSFSRDGRTMGLDLDGPHNNKGLYALATLQPTTVIGKDNLVAWTRDQNPRETRVGFMSQVSPDGRYVLTTVHDTRDALTSYYVSNFKDYRFLQVFYPTRGILDWYDRTTGLRLPLPGASDRKYVQTDGVWSPDGAYVVFARAEAKDAYVPGQKMAAYANDPGETQIQYDLYRVPFNGGKGGDPQPIAGASANGMSNTFPKVSPDGRWIVFVKCRNGQLMRPDSQLYIVPAEGGEARRMRCNTPLMNSWHSFSPNGRWLVFSSKSRSPYTQMFLTHIDEDGNDSPAILIEDSTAANRAVNIPEFVNIPPDGLAKIDTPALDFYKEFDVAWKLLDKKQYEAAIPAWEKAVALDPTDATAHMNLGVSLAQTGRPDVAVQQFDKAREIDPQNPDPYSHLGDALARMGKPREAIPDFEKALELRPQDAQTRDSLGLALAKAGQPDEAIEQYRQARDLQPDNADFNTNLGVALAQAGKPDDAIPVLEKALLLNPRNASAESNLGAAYDAKGMVENAILHLQKALEIDAADPRAHTNLGIALAGAGRMDDALPHFRKAAEMQPGDAGVQANLGGALAEAGNADEAIAHFEKAVQIAPDLADTRFPLGALYFQKGRVADALAQWRRVVEIQPQNITALNALAQALSSNADATLRNGAEAVRLAESAVTVAGDQEPLLLDTLAAAYAEAGRFADAVRTAHRALDVARAQNNQQLADRVESQIALYESGKPFRIGSPQ